CPVQRFPRRVVLFTEATQQEGVKQKNHIVMKSLVFSAIICAATVGNSEARTLHAEGVNMHRTELTGNPKTVEAFKGEIAFHRRNLAVLWDQYQRMEAKIKSGPGNH